jgi:crotonobetainyl-CoA:carnitine CoA-transferase CaiB-like acyl-CoA transferase
MFDLRRSNMYHMCAELPRAEPRAGALEGLRILDFSRVLAGPFATMILADLGAEVLKIERPGHGDDTRAWVPPVDAGGQSTYFDAVNRNKRSIALDLTDQADRAVAGRLALGADAIVENFRPGLLDSFGLGYDELRRANPGLVYCSITGFGRDAVALPGYDLLVQALGGLMSITGAPDGEPQKVGVALVDVLTGLFATVGILAAVRHRDRVGEGQRVEVDLLSSLLAALVNQATAYTAAGVVAARMGNAHPSIAPYDLLGTGDGELVLAVGTDRQFAALCAVLGAPELAADARFATNPDRVANRHLLIPALERRLAARSAGEWAQLLTDARVPAGVVNDIAGAFELAGRLGLNPVVEFALDRAAGSPAAAVTAPGSSAAVRTPGSSEALTAPTLRIPRNPINLSATPADYRIAPPPLPERDPDRAVDWGLDPGLVSRARLSQPPADTARSAGRRPGSCRRPGR